MKYKVQQFAFESGERYALLINAQTNVPFMHQNLYVTINIRNTGGSITTMGSCLGDLRLLDEICEYLDIKLEKRFAEGKLLTKPEMELVNYWTKKKKVALEKAQKVKGAQNVTELKPNLKRLESSRHTVAIDTDLVKVNTTYNRLINIIPYIVWLAKSLVSASELKLLDEMETFFKTLMPTKQPPNNDPNVF